MSVPRLLVENIITELMDWKPICVVRPDGEGNCSFEDAVAAKHRSRFYRVVTAD